MIEPECFYFNSRAGFKLYGRYWNKEGAKGTVIGVHGYSEHSGRYLHFADFLVQNNYETIWLDLPGHGMSEGKRSNIDSFNDYILSLEALVNEAERRNCPRPFHLFGHSLGGLVATRFIESTQKNNRKNNQMNNQMRSLTLSSPFFGIANYSSLGMALLGIFTNLVPNFSVENKGMLEEDSLSHDKVIMHSRAADPLIKPMATAHWVRESLKARCQAFRDAPKISIPVAIFQAGDEKVTRRRDTEKFFARLKTPKKQWKLYDGFYHEILNELDRARVMNDMLSWLKSI